MSYFLINLLLALLWAALQQFRPIDFVTGYVVGFIILALGRNWFGGGTSRYLARMRHFVSFVGFYILELFHATHTVTRALLRDQSTLRPGIIAYRLQARSEMEIALLNNLLSLPPGTFGVRLSADHKVLYIHLIDVPDPEAARQRIRTGLERRLLEVLR